MTERDPIFLRHELHEFALDLHCVRTFDDAEAIGEPCDVRVHDDADADAEGFTEDDVGSLASNAGQRVKFIHRLRDFAAVFLDQALAAALDVLRLVVEEAGGLNQLFKFFNLRPGEICCCAIFLEQIWRDDVHALVGALRGKDRGYEQLERISEVKFAAKIGVSLFQDADDLSGAGGFGLGGFSGHGEENGARYRVRTCDSNDPRTMCVFLRKNAFCDMA